MKLLIFFAVLIACIAQLARAVPARPIFSLEGREGGGFGGGRGREGGYGEGFGREGGGFNGR